MVKLILTTTSAILLTFIAWFMVKTYADNKPHEPREAPFFSESFDYVAKNSGQFPPNTKMDFDYLVKSNPKVVLKIPLQYTVDHEPVVFEHEGVDFTTDGTGPIWKKTFAELQTLDAGYKFKDSNGNFSFREKNLKILHLKDIFKMYPNQRLVLHLAQKYTELSQSVYELIKEHNAFHKVIVSCDSSQPLQYFRKIDPRIFTSASVDEVLRLNTLLSLQLQGLDNMRADLYIVPLESNGLKIFSKSLTEEVHKRGKKIYVKLENPTALSTIHNSGADGVITRFILDKK